MVSRSRAREAGRERVNKQTNKRSIDRSTALPTWIQLYHVPHKLHQVVVVAVDSRRQNLQWIVRPGPVPQQLRQVEQRGSFQENFTDDAPKRKHVHRRLLHIHTQAMSVRRTSRTAAATLFLFPPLPRAHPITPPAAPTTPTPLGFSSRKTSPEPHSTSSSIPCRRRTKSPTGRPTECTSA